MTYRGPFFGRISHTTTASATISRYTFGVRIGSRTFSLSFAASRHGLVLA